MRTARQSAVHGRRSFSSSRWRGGDALWKVMYAGAAAGVTPESDMSIGQTLVHVAILCEEKARSCCHGLFAALRTASPPLPVPPDVVTLEPAKLLPAFSLGTRLIWPCSHS